MIPVESNPPVIHSGRFSPAESTRKGRKNPSGQSKDRKDNADLHNICREFEGLCFKMLGNKRL